MPKNVRSVVITEISDDHEQPKKPKNLREAIVTGSMSLLLLPWGIMGIFPQEAMANSTVIDLGTIDYNPPPPGRDAPGNRGGGGGRGCGLNSQPVTALIPTQKQMLNGDPEKEIIQVWGTTLYSAKLRTGLLRYMIKVI